MFFIGNLFQSQVTIYYHHEHKLLTHSFVSLYPAVRFITLQWRHHGRDSVSNHQPHDCLLDRLFRRRSKKISKLRVTGLCAGNSPATGEFPAQRASNTENVSIWWRHHDNYIGVLYLAPHFLHILRVWIYIEIYSCVFFLSIPDKIYSWFTHKTNGIIFPVNIKLNFLPLTDDVHTFFIVYISFWWLAMWWAGV